LDTGSIEKVSEEMADVEIMIEQLKELIGNRDQVDWYVKYKIDRTIERSKGDAI
jgi:hypothetical protein